MNFIERLRAVESRLEQSEREYEKVNVAFFRLCEFIGVKYEILFKSDILFDWDDFEVVEDTTKSKEQFPPIAQIDVKMEEEKKKVADKYE